MLFKRSFVIISIFILFVNCHEDSSLQPGESSNGQAQLSILSGNNQIGTPYNELPEPIVISALDNNGNVYSNLNLTCTIVEGEGELISDNVITTDAIGRAEVRLKIGHNYNSVKISQAGEDFSENCIYVYASTANPRGMHKIRSLNTFQKLSNTFYSLEFFGDYTEILNRENRRFLGSDPSTMSDNYHCSLFTAYGDSSRSLFGRSFDNPSDWQCLTLAMRTHPPDGYESISFMRLRDIGFETGTDLLLLEDDEKTLLLDAVFHCPDGINEHGVVAGLANVNVLSFTPDNSKKSIWITYLVREILDHAQNVEEAVEVMRQYNICCPSRTNLGIHVLVADPQRSVILEMFDGGIKVIPNDMPWQVITNSPCYNVSIDQQKNNCSRFRRIYNSLESCNGAGNFNLFVDLLSSVGWSSTEWSAVYDMSNKSVKVFIDYDFSGNYTFSFNGVN